MALPTPTPPDDPAPQPTRISNYTGQIMLGLGAAALAALFVVLRSLIRHWQAWHLGVVAIVIIIAIVLWRLRRKTP